MSEDPEIQKLIDKYLTPSDKHLISIDHKLGQIIGLLQAANAQEKEYWETWKQAKLKERNKPNSRRIKGKDVSKSL